MPCAKKGAGRSTTTVKFVPLVSGDALTVRIYRVIPCSACAAHFVRRGGDCTTRGIPAMAATMTTALCAAVPTRVDRAHGSRNAGPRPGARRPVSGHVEEGASRSPAPGAGRPRARSATPIAGRRGGARLHVGPTATCGVAARTSSTACLARCSASWTDARTEPGRCLIPCFTRRKPRRRRACSSEAGASCTSATSSARE